MGAEPWSYFVAYKSDISAALHELREQEFHAGRYYTEGGATEPPTSIEEAFERAGASGTRSILDVQRVSETLDFCAVAPLTQEELIRLFGTDKPTRQMVEEAYDFGSVDRGQGIYIVVYKDDRPDEIFFAGYSFD